MGVFNFVFLLHLSFLHFVFVRHYVLGSIAVKVHSLRVQYLQYSGIMSDEVILISQSGRLLIVQQRAIANRHVVAYVLYQFGHRRLCKP